MCYETRVEVVFVGVVALIVMFAVGWWGVHDHYLMQMQPPPANAIDVGATGLGHDTVGQIECGSARLSHIEWTDVPDPVSGSPFNPAGFMANREYHLGTVYCGGRIVTLKLRADDRANARRIVALGSEDAWLKTVCPRSGPPYYQHERIDLDDDGSEVATVTCYSGYHAVDRRLIE